MQSNANFLDLREALKEIKKKLYSFKLCYQIEKSINIRQYSPKTTFNEEDVYLIVIAKSHVSKIIAEKSILEFEAKIKKK